MAVNWSAIGKVAEGLGKAGAAYGAYRTYKASKQKVPTAPTPSEWDDDEIEATRERRRRRAMNAKGNRSTLLTGVLDWESEVPTKGKSGLLR